MAAPDSSITFHLIEAGVVILRSKGVFRQAKVYHRKRYIYAGVGGGFVRLEKHNNGTSQPGISYEDLFLPFEPGKDAIGRLTVPESVDLTAL